MIKWCLIAANVAVKNKNQIGKTQMVAVKMMMLANAMGNQGPSFSFFRDQAKFTRGPRVASRPPQVGKPSCFAVGLVGS